MLEGFLPAFLGLTGGGAALLGAYIHYRSLRFVNLSHTLLISPGSEFIEFNPILTLTNRAKDITVIRHVVWKKFTKTNGNGKIFTSTNLLCIFDEKSINESIQGHVFTEKYDLLPGREIQLCLPHPIKYADEHEALTHVYHIEVHHSQGSKPRRFRMIGMNQEILGWAQDYFRRKRSR